MATSIARASRDDWVKTSTGLVVPASYQQKRRHPTAIDLFCGAGGFSLGFVQAGFEVVAGVDDDPVAAITYMVNLGSHPMQIHYVTEGDEERLARAVEREQKRSAKNWQGFDGTRIERCLTSGSGWIAHHPDVPAVKHFFFGDARKLAGQRILDAIGMERGDVDCVFGGPPCQGFSKAGGRRREDRIADPRNNLVFEFARLVVEMMPRTMVMENVPEIAGMRTPTGEPILDRFCRILEDGGFGTLDAIKQALEMSSGSGAALRGFPARESAPAEQPSLF